MEETKLVKLYKGEVELKFVTDHADKHAYYDKTGKRLNGVTYYTGVIDKSDALCGWTAKMIGLYLLKEKQKGNDIITEELVETAKREYRRLRKEAADIGKEIHLWISEKISGKNPAMPENEKVINGITAFLKFQKEHQVKWLESERLVYSKKFQYPGTADAIGKIGKDLILFDFKSSKPSSISPDGVYPEHALQTVAYQQAWEEEMKKKIDYRIIITLDKETGQFRFRRFQDNKNDIAGFINCLQLRRRLDELKRI